MLKLRRKLIFEDIVEVLELVGATVEELVNVDVLGHPSLRPQRL